MLRFYGTRLRFRQRPIPRSLPRCDFRPSLLYHNLKNGTFEEVGIYADVALNHAGEEQAAWELQSLTTMKMVRLTSPKQTSATTFRIFITLTAT